MTMVFQQQLKKHDEQRDIERLERSLRELYKENITAEEIQIEERAMKRVLRVSEEVFEAIKERVKKELQ